MTGIRQKKKTEYKRRILESAKALFLSQGYDATTTEQIAEKAELGVGTVYNYFKSKADIFIETVADEFGEDKVYDISGIVELNKGIADTVYEFFNSYTKGTKFLGKKLLKELIAAAFGSFKSNPNFIGKLIALDFKLLDDLVKLLDYLKEKGVLKESYDSKQGAEVVYGAIAFEFLSYIYAENISFEECKDKIRKKLEFIFNH